MLIYALAALLCTLYAVDTLLVAYNYRFYASNPPSSKLLFLSEAVKLLIASCLYLLERKRHDDVQLSKGKGLPVYDQQQQQMDWLGRCQSVLRGMVVFAVPALCYFATNNLSFFALRIMSAHTYTLLSDLKVITTGLLGYLVLDKRLNRQAVMSLVMLFTGISIGHLSTMKDSKPPPGINSLATDNSWLLGLLLMGLISVLSAIASIYTEWVMNFSSSYRHESLHLQNMRLYVSGTALNFLYCLAYNRPALSTWTDMRAAHWVLVVMYAVMGLVTSVIIKRFGSIVKVYASCVASLFAAGMSYTLLHDPPAALFYVGCMLAMVATLQLQQARAAAEDPEGRKGQQGSLKATQLLPLVAVVAVFLLLVPQSKSPCLPTPRNNMPMVREDKYSIGNSTLGPTTDAPMMMLPPFQPTCFAEASKMHNFGCPVMECSRDPSCTIFNTSCCAYFNMQMLDLFDRFLTSKCLQDQYQVVYGTALGAVRNQTILPHTEDVDLGITPLALQYLEQNATREELWRHGYAFWYHEHRGVWKLCPHLHHPSPHFRSVMRLDESLASWEKRNKLFVAVYLDMWLMWPVQPTASKCTKFSGISKEAQLAVPWNDDVAGTGGATVDVCARRGAVAGATANVSSGSDSKYCVLELGKPLSVRPGLRAARIGNLSFPVAANQEELLVQTYGPNWRNPENAYHGRSANTREGRVLRQALLEKLSVTAWGDTPLQQRKKQCKQLQRQQRWGRCSGMPQQQLAA